ncbi:MAG: nicotinate-nucleotide--dimethylbenzimidazole phosphoribosyltransferase [Rhodospirillales bacterium]|nr:nicotinate-nucleotide--dimethylbenzimidazole phosphoribosyltransferase [Rhodospirillales bacterium]MBT4625471.1 nicotinate-nucleotide--dimethylbenzimidazole phosphoribosyltransferase [Rhodospirillales bacterium]MBT5521878.1 nicotinate-nucleotide--dimethylbenzimidazole phosphoribosyltransferase [Rhodospirillales bacterium]MBT6109801.1 nicotinate-nucleotide--dimethylbenzimidazole phosphoribosyltransferase [Rhodospirillales bacterium]MBT6825578.1 nicotinate-nucleotide--dimethylbenzimidazole pho
MLDSINDIRGVIENLPGPDASAEAAANEREPQLTKPAGSLGRLEQIAAWLATWQRSHPPALGTVAVHVFAGNHGVTKQGVSAFPSEVTAQMVGNFQAGGAAINQLCKAQGAALQVFPLELDNPTADFSESPAMNEGEFVTAFNVGWNSVHSNMDLLCVGEMGIGNTTAAAAIAHALFGGTGEDWAGPGTGVSGEALSHKASVISAAVETHQGAMTDGLEILRHVGGRELAAMAGAIVAARIQGVPVVLDGYVATAAAGPIAVCAEGALDHCIAGHVSKEPGHRRLLEKLGLDPLLDLDMRLGEASGAAVAIGIIRAAHACHTGMATFAEAGVADKDA